MRTDPIFLADRPLIWKNDWARKRRYVTLVIVDREMTRNVVAINASGMIKRMALLTAIGLMGMRSLPGQSGTIFIRDRRPYLSEPEVMALQRSIRDLDTNTAKPDYRVIDVLKVQDSYYVFPNGLNDVYVWSGDQLKPVFESPFQGQNFGSIKFVYHHEIHSYGGYGYWNFYGDVTRFDQVTNEWVLVPGLQDKPAVDATNFRFCFIRDSLLYAYFQWSWPYRTNRNNPIKEDVLYSYNLNTNRWKLEGDVSNHFPRQLGDAHYESANYILEFNKEGIGILLDKRSLQFKYNLPLYRLSARYPELVAGNTLSCRQIRNDSICFYDTSRLRVVVNLKEIDQAASGTSEPMILPPSWEAYAIGLGGLALLLTGAGIFYLRKRKSPQVMNASASRIHEESSWPELHPYIGQTIVQQVLDECLGIQEVASSNIQRNKRSALIKQINEDDATGFRIERVRNAEDSRIYDYHIRFIPKN